MITRTLLVVGALSLPNLVCFAGEKEVVSTPIVPIQQNPNRDSLWYADTDFSYTFGSKFRRESDFGRQSEYHFNIRFGRRFELSENWRLSLGIEDEQFRFSRSNSFLPYSLNKLAAEVGLGWRNPLGQLQLTLHPGVYYTRDHITSNSFDMPFALVGTRRLTSNFSLSLGVDGSILSENHISPIGGFVWDINDRLELRALFPHPGLSYALNDSTKLFLGADFLGGAFRNGPTNDPRTNKAALTYQESRVGGGISFHPHQGVKLSLSSGYSFERKFDYYHRGPIFRSKGAPYVQLQVELTLPADRRYDSF
jgi:Domain of unknown function (DUF6268)